MASYRWVRSLEQASLAVSDAWTVSARRYPDGRLMEVWPRKDDKVVTDSWTGVQMALPTMLRYPFRILLHVQHLRATSEAQMCFGLDDFSLSPECFGLGVPANETREFPGKNRVSSVTNGCS